MYTKSKNHAEIFTNGLIKKFTGDIDQLKTGTKSVSYGRSIIPISYLDSFRLVYEFNPSNSSESIFRSVLIKNMKDSELTTPGSSFVANMSFLKAIQSNSEDNQSSIEELKKMSYKSRRGNKEKLLDFLRIASQDNQIMEILNDVISKGGINGSCDIVESYEYYDEVEIENSSKFKVRVNPSFSLSIGKEEIEKSNSYIIVADGVIDSVSEIHHILEHFYKNQSYCFIVCRGYSNDVLKTLSENFKLGKLKVIPCELITSLKSINSLKDISVVSGQKLISTLAGENFSSIDTSEIFPVDFIKAGRSFLEIKNASQQSKLISLVQKIRKSIQEETVEDKIDLLQERISSINPRRIVVKISNHNKDSFGIKKDKIKFLIALINSCCDTGFIPLNQKIKNPLLKSIIDDLKSFGFDFFPAITLCKGIESGIKNANLVHNTKKIIVVES